MLFYIKILLKMFIKVFIVILLIKRNNIILKLNNAYNISVIEIKTCKNIILIIIFFILYITKKLKAFKNRIFINLIN